MRTAENRGLHYILSFGRLANFVACRAGFPLREVFGEFLDVCKAIRAQKNHSPVIMLTAFEEVDDKVLGFESGADDYLAKPFYFKELLARIKSLINFTRASARSGQ